MIEIPNKKESAIDNWSKIIIELRLKELRDGFLVIAALLYFLGYIVWCLHALRFNLGLLPALDSQYFIAGFIPAAFTVMFYVLSRYLDKISRRWRYAITPNVVGWRRLLRMIIFGMFFLAFFMMWAEIIVGIKSHGENLPIYWKIVRWAAVIFSIICILLWPPTRLEAGPINWVYRLMRWFAVRYIVLAASGMLIVVYIVDIHPRIPAELGGGRPRCAILDVTKGRMSESLLSVMAPSPSDKTSSEVLRSIKIRVFFTGNDYLLVKPDNDAHAFTNTYEIKKEIIQSITWCQH